MPLDPKFLRAEELGMRLEVVSDLPIWEAHPVSKGYEAKDLEIGPPFYLAQGVKDVIVFDPTSHLVLHARREKTVRLTSPQALSLECGCELTV